MNRFWGQIHKLPAHAIPALPNNFSDMFKSIPTISAIGAATLILCACGGGGSDGGGTTPDSPAAPVADNVKWASFGQFVGANEQFAAMLVTGPCFDANNKNRVVNGGGDKVHAIVNPVAIKLMANGDVSYSEDGVEKALVTYSTRTEAEVITSEAAPGKTTAVFTGYTVAPDHENAMLDSETLGTERFTIAKNGANYQISFVRNGTGKKLNVTCTLTHKPVISSPGLMTMARVNAAVVPAKQVAGSTITGSQDGSMHFRFSYPNGVLEVMGRDTKSVALNLEEDMITEFAQKYRKTPATDSTSSANIKYTHWATIRIQTATQPNWNGKLFFGYDSTAATPEVMLTTDEVRKVH